MRIYSRTFATTIRQDAEEGQNEQDVDFKRKNNLRTCFCLCAFV